MSAAATASLTIQARTVGLADLRALSGELQKLAGLSRRAGRTGVGGAAGASAGVRAVGTEAARSRQQVRTLEQEIDRLQRRRDQSAITARARGRLGMTQPGERTVQGELLRLKQLERNREITAQARGQLGMGPSILTGHGFLHRGRQTLGLMRDLTVAGMGVRYGFQTAAAGVGALINPVRDFERVMSRVRIKGGFSAAEMEEIAATAREQGRTTQFTAAQSAEAGVELAAAGLGAKDVATGIPTALRFALAGDISTETAASTLVETASQFNKSAADFEHIGNVYQKAADMSTLAVGDLVESFSYVGPIAKTAGVNFEETAAMLALLGNRGIKASMAGTALRRMFTSMVKPTSTTRSAMEDLKLSEEEVAAGLQNLPGFLDTVHARLQKFSQPKQLEILAKLFGTRGVAAANVLLDTASSVGPDGVDELERFTRAMHDSTGAMKTAADIAGNTLDGQIKKMNSAIESARIDIGKKLVPALTAAIPVIANAAIATGDYAANHGTLVESVLVGVPSFVAAAFAIKGVAAAVGGVKAAAAALGVAELGVSVGTAFGTSIVGAMLPVIAAGLAAFSVASVINQAIVGDEHGWNTLGVRIYEAIHGKRTGVEGDAETLNAQTERTDREHKKKMAERKAQFERDMDDPVMRNLLMKERGIDDPILSNLRSEQAPASMRAWSGKLSIEITESGKAKVAGLQTDGPEIDVGTNVGP